MNKRFIHFLILFVALLMPFQAFSMAMVMGKTNCAENSHCKQMLNMQKTHANTAMGEHCNMQKTQHGKQAPQKPVCCQGSTCAALCVVFTLPTSESALTLNTINNFSFFVTSHFYTQSPDGLERPPRC